jgi:hypothetical protein
VNLLPKIFPQDDPQQASDDSFERELIRREAELGSQLFGPVPKNHRREFFCLDERTWVWHEEWQEEGKRKTITTRYEVRPDGVLKVQDGQVYSRLSRDEARNLYQATEIYRQRVGADYHRLLQTA